MLAKPAECVGCPWYGDGRGFIPDFNLHKAKVIFVGQNPGADEELAEVPFIGKSGQILRGFVQQYLAAVPVGYANLVKCRRQQDGRRSNAMPKPRTKEWQEIVGECTRRHLRLPLPIHSEDCAISINMRHGCTCGAEGASPLIVACGEHAAAWLAPELKGPELHIRGSYINDSVY